MEREFHRWLAEQVTPHRSVQLGIGDDAAIVDLAGRPLVVTTDTIADGTHFLIEQHAPSLIGRKAMAVNISDIAAMGACPVAAVLHFMLPKEFGLSRAQALFAGMHDLANRYDVAIVGGDTNVWDGPLLVGATLMGSLASDQHAWRMDATKSGDAIFVSGEYGGSILGHHLSFDPEVDLANALAPTGSVTAATDVSDSLSSDLAALAAASKCGALIDLEAIPIAAAAFELAKQEVGPDSTDDQINQRALEHALEDGEDFGLILAVPADRVDSLLEHKQHKRLTRIGTFCEQPGLWANRKTGLPASIEVKGYDHG